MEPNVTHEILDLWERGAGSSALARTMVLWSAATGADDPEAMWTVPLGRCNLELLRLRRRLFGNVMLGYAQCEACGEGNELEVLVDAFLVEGETGARALSVEDYELRLRPLTHGDVRAALRHPPAEQHSVLARRSVAEARVRGDRVDAERLPAHVLERVAKSTDDVDPLAGIELGLACVSCGHEWSVPLDIADYLWREVERRAQRLLDEVSLLARAYGWTEPTALALSPSRKRAYLQRAAAWIS